jgi:hypothetical protein
VHQAKYTKDILKTFKMDDSKPLLTLMSTTTTLNSDEGREPVDQKELPEHDRLPLVFDGNEARHPVFYVSVHSFSGVAKDFTSAGHQ